MLEGIVRQHVIKAASKAVVDLLNEYDPEELEPVMDEASAELGARMAERTADNLAPLLRPVIEVVRTAVALVEASKVVAVACVIGIDGGCGDCRAERDTRAAMTDLAMKALVLALSKVSV